MTDSSTAALDYSREVLLQVLRERSPSWEQGSDVGHIARELGTTLGLDAETVATMFYAAELHGIGKVAIPEAILHKPAKLTEEEWAVVRGHVEAAKRILSAVPPLVPASDVIYSVYERWDGAGYPKGLAGEEIALPARIVSVCVAFHAMTVARPYREAMELEDALAQLEAGAGTQFDPAVVSELVAMVNAMMM